MTDDPMPTQLTLDLDGLRKLRDLLDTVLADLDHDASAVGLDPEALGVGMLARTTAGEAVTVTSDPASGTFTVEVDDRA
jgi:hypothetical protein